MLKEMVDNNVMNLVRQKDEIIFNVLGVDCLISDAAQAIKVIDPEVLRQLHFEVVPGEETLFLNDKPLVTFFAPKIEQTMNESGVVLTCTQQYRTHK